MAPVPLPVPTPNLTFSNIQNVVPPAPQDPPPLAMLYQPRSMPNGPLSLPGQIDAQSTVGALVAGFEDFMRPKSITSLRWAALSGPIIILLASSSTCSALYADSILAAASGGHAASAPPWFAQALQLGLQPINTRLDAIDARLDGIVVKIDQLTIFASKMTPCRRPIMMYAHLFLLGKYMPIQLQTSTPLTDVIVLDSLAYDELKAYYPPDAPEGASSCQGENIFLMQSALASASTPPLALSTGAVSTGTTVQPVATASISTPHVNSSAGTPLLAVASGSSVPAGSSTLPLRRPALNKYVPPPPREGLIVPKPSHNPWS
ncbi:hypothetical protein B0H13DRAFT_2303525 [Mycena leptocephala]|nr:hypothetical protein B0H13DRAFT_2303525 [Mycena leptocephala]